MEEKTDPENDLLMLVCPSCEKVIIIDKKQIEKDHIFEPCHCGRMVLIDNPSLGLTEAVAKRVPRY